MQSVDSMLTTILLVLMMASIPFFGRAVKRNPAVNELLYSGWTPIILAMLISRYS